ncbi:SusC/RagA family TonB-linked outer membrane protein [Chryseolinea soli]|nr:SusC/RagA family TonB-linked outer membrane protein [Chryseolinea soli]
MKNRYLLLGMLLVAHLQAMSQHDPVYAAATRPRVAQQRTGDASSLKQALTDLEHSFAISIAYKDEWIENKQVRFSARNFKAVEQALDSVLKDTGLYYEKAGDGFYVIYKKTARTAEQPQSSTVLVPALALNKVEDFDTFLERDMVRDVARREELLAQTVTGTIREEGGAGFPGVNVVVKGTTTGTTTDADGRYSIVVDNENAVLVFSFVGYATQEITVAGRSVIDVNMAPDLKSLDEVVVTALGIERSAKSLGYSTSKVSSDAFAVNRSTNVMNTLQGKIAGVNVTSLGTGPGGSSKIRIRGQSSIGGQNTPLIVVNGVPIDNTNFGTNQGNTAGDNSVNNKGGGASTDGGDGLNSINPDDVESMTVLKGATAAALYGSRAQNGVIMITTKSRNSLTKGVGVTYNMNFTDEKVLDYTDYQYEYGQGENGLGPASAGALPNPTTGQWSFGPKIEPGMTQLLFNNVQVPYVAQKGIINQFYRHGQNFTNSVSVSANGEKGGMNLSVSNMDSKGVTPNNTFNRKTLNLGFGYDLSSKLSFKGNVNYANEYSKNPPVVSDQDNSIPTSLYAMANTMPLDVLRDNRYNAGGGEYVYSRFTNRTNPYWVLDQVKQNIRRDRIFGNLSAKYNFTKWLNLQVRGGQDYWSRDADYINLPTGKASISSGSVNSAVSGFYNGLYTQESRRFRETNIDFLLRANKDFQNFGVDVSVGGNRMHRRSDTNTVQVTDFAVKDLYTVQNGRAKDPTYDLVTRSVNSLYGMAEVNYKQFLYLNLTTRDDWFSTLSPGKRKKNYSSVSASYVFSQMMGGDLNWLDFGKIRAAYARVGSDSDVPPYSQQLIYTVNANQFQGQPVGTSGTIVPNLTLSPMQVDETELGLELKMFGNRVNMDVAVYRKITTDQIVRAQISDASGFINTLINHGKSQNKGIELMLNVVPLRTDNFQWDLTFNGAYNITKVLSLLTTNDGENITVGTHVFNGYVQQIVGQEMGQIVGFGYRRDDGSVEADHKGMIVYGANGVALPTTKLIPFGSALPKWVGGITNSFNYKGITASVLIDFKLGGKVLSGTNFNAYRHGLSKETLFGREGGIDPVTGAQKGAVVGVGVDVNSNINTKAAGAEDFYSVVRGSGIVEPVIYNAGYWKLRQITVGYDFTKFLKATFPIKGIRLSFVANNVLMIKKWVPNIDPESFSYSSDNVVGLESPSVPTTRSIGFNLNVKF